MSYWGVIKGFIMGLLMGYHWVIRRGNAYFLQNTGWDRNPNAKKVVKRMPSPTSKTVLGRKISCEKGTE